MVSSNLCQECWMVHASYAFYFPDRMLSFQKLLNMPFLKISLNFTWIRKSVCLFFQYSHIQGRGISNAWILRKSCSFNSHKYSVKLLSVPSTASCCRKIILVLSEHDLLSKCKKFWVCNCYLHLGMRWVLVVLVRMKLWVSPTRRLNISKGFTDGDMLRT